MDAIKIVSERVEELKIKYDMENAKTFPIKKQLKQLRDLLEFNTWLLERLMQPRLARVYIH